MLQCRQQSRHDAHGQGNYDRFFQKLVIRIVVRSVVILYADYHDVCRRRQQTYKLRNYKARIRVVEHRQQYARNNERHRHKADPPFFRKLSDLIAHIAYNDKCRIRKIEIFLQLVERRHVAEYHIQKRQLRY